ncbi:MAG: hypothetical protein JW776_04920 [Candidatus Lokiarchaeota archaeon]|nr:hypothetical protein [Candidatus Lokiarchaeota archaeon]
MDTGKFLALLGGIITFAGTWWLTLFAVSATEFAYAVGGIMQYSNIIANAASNALGVDPWVIYLLVVFYSIYLISFIFQLLGGKSRISAFIGSILPLAVGVMIMVYSLFGSFSIIMPIMGTFSGDAVIEGWFPFNYVIGSQIEAIGTYAIIFGSLLAFISAFIPRKDQY